MDRRSFLNASALSLSMGLLWGCSRSASKSDNVFLHYDQAALDAAYDQNVWAHPGFEQTIASYGIISDQVKAQYPFVTVNYGDKPSEQMDIFKVAGAIQAPIHVFIHGGAWKALSKDTSAGPAPVFVGNNIIFVAINFDNLPLTTLSGMIEQCRTALKWVYLNAASVGGDPHNITLSGHSSGAHLAAVMLTTDWRRYQVPQDFIKGAVLISGMCDLKAPVLSSRGAYLKLSDDEVRAFSPVNHLERVQCQVFVAWGEHESPEFKRQSMEMAQALKERGRLQGAAVLPGLDHFQAALELNDAESLLAKVAIDQTKRQQRA
jgi:arylformamidase